MRLLFHKTARALFLVAFTFISKSATLSAQTASEASKPYATLDRQAVSYRGPTVAAEQELSNSKSNVVIGLIVPMKGAQQAEGAELLTAAQLAIEDERPAGSLADGRRFELVARDESGQWGQASMEILKLFEEDHAMAILTSSNGTSAHLAEQIANKISVPILTLASDPTTTQTNVPWLFRLGPSDTDQARAFCRRIYVDLKLQRVLLISQADHDGRIGADEFEKAAKAIDAPVPFRLELNEFTEAAQSLRIALQKTDPDAIVIWTDEPLANGLTALTENVRPFTPVFLCRKAAQLSAKDTNSAKWFTLDSPSSMAPVDLANFQKAFFDRTGKNPGIAANQMYQVVRMLASALRITGVNRVLLRNYLANHSPNKDKSIPFDPAGNCLQEFAIIKVQTITP